MFQINILNENIKLLSGFLKRCPACLHNLVKHLCDFTCSKEQSDFLEVLSLEKHANGTEYVTEVNFYLDEGYANGTFQSCSEVFYPPSGQLALELMCGGWGALKCNPYRWLHFMGDMSTNTYVPFQINYKIRPEPVYQQYKPLKPTIVPCYEAINVSTC